MTLEQALEKATTVYRRLLAQGRSEPDARRDAERWVKGNFGLAVTLPAPVQRKQTVHGYGEVGVTFTSASESYSHFANAAAAVYADLWRTMNPDNERQRDNRRKGIYADITRLELERSELQAGRCE